MPPIDHTLFQTRKIIAIAAVFFLLVLICLPRSGDAYPRVTLAEVFTNTGCPLCGQYIPPAEAVMQEFEADSYIQISYHTWWPIIHDPWYTEMYYRQLPDDDDVILRVTSYEYDQFMGVPSFFFDGQRIRYRQPINEYQAEIRELMQSQLDNETPVNIEIETEINGDDLTVWVRVISDEDISGITLYGGLCERYVHFAADSRQSDFYGNMLDMIPTGEGIRFRLMADQWERFEFNTSLDLGWHENDLSNLFVAFWVQDDETHAIYQAFEQALDQNDPTVLIVDASDAHDLGFELHQLFGQNDIPFADRWVRADDGEVSAQTLADYRTVIWHSFNEDGDVMSDDEELALVGYLNAGGTLVVSGCFLADEVANSMLFQGLMGVEIDEQNTGLNLVRTSGACPAFNDFEAYLGGAGGYARPACTPSVTPRRGATGILEYVSEGETAGYAGVVRVTDEYKTMFLAFPVESMEGVGGTDDKAEFVNRIFNWIANPMDAPQERQIAPESLTLASLYPNPFNSTTTIRYTLPALAMTRLSVFDLNGREVARLAEGLMPAGDHSLEFNAQGLTAGLYIVALDADGVVLREKAVYVK